MVAPIYSLNARLVVSLLLLAALALNWVPLLDELAQAYLSDTISSNAIVFGVVRSLNAVISVVQSAEVGVGVAGIGLGEIFDPVNDLIERFSGLLLVTLTALGIQQVLLIFTSSIALKIVFSLVVGITLALLWWQPQRIAIWLRIVILLTLLRFLLNLEVGLVWLFDWAYFNATGAEALSVIEAATQIVQNLRDSLTSFDITDFFFGNDNTVTETEDIATRISASVVTLIVGMLFKSILIPVGTVWLAWKFSGKLLWP